MTDKIFRKTTEVYAKDEPKFFKDFAVVFQKCVAPPSSRPPAAHPH